MLTDLTQKFNKISSISSHELRAFEEENQEKINIRIQSEICLKQAEDVSISLNKILYILQNSKQNYFSNAAYSMSAFNDNHRNQFNNEITSSLDFANMKITQFKEAIEKLHCRNITEKQHFRGIAICLYQQFKQCSFLFRQFLAFHEERKLKLQKMMNIQLKKDFKQQKLRNVDHQLKMERKISSIDQELQQQSKTIFMEKAAQQQKIEDTRKTLQQINQVLGHMSNKVLEQELLTSSFREIGQIGLQSIERGNKNLIQANTLSKETGKYWSYYFLFLAFSLLILDFIKS